MPINVIFLLVVTHFVADFLLQNDWMALNKSKSWFALFAHTCTYSYVFMLVILRLRLGFTEDNWYRFVADPLQTRSTSGMLGRATEIRCGTTR